MAISRRPGAQAAQVDVEALIGKGGSVPRERPGSDGGEDIQRVQLRLSPRLIEQIDEVLKQRPVRIPRHTWLLEAVHDKLAKESGKE